ncbi:MAG: hypothetical protein OXF75_13790 [Acidimicrobiaceae bacterium]|nr:hypothetical protein [Acidimicrobiaceae bacterium]
MRSRQGIAILAVLVVGGLLAVTAPGSVSAQMTPQTPQTAADWTGTIDVDLIDDATRHAGSTDPVASLAAATSISESGMPDRPDGSGLHVWLRLTFAPPLPPPGPAAEHSGAGIVVCWSGTAKWAGRQADVTVVEGFGDSSSGVHVSAYPLRVQPYTFLGNTFFQWPVRPLPGCTVVSLRHDPGSIFAPQRHWERSTIYTDVDADGNLVSARVHVTDIVDDDRWEADETLTATVMPRSVARWACEDGTKPSPFSTRALLDCGDGFTPVGPVGDDDLPSASLTIIDDDDPCAGSVVDNPCYYNTVPPRRGVWVRNPNGPSMPDDPLFVTVSHSSVYGDTSIRNVPGFREVDLGELVLQPVRDDADGHAYVVTVPQQPAADQTLVVTMTVDDRNMNGPKGSVTVTPQRLEFTAADWGRPRLVKVTASADARPGDVFTVRHWFSEGFADGYIAYHRFHYPWATVPRFDVAGRVSDDAVFDADAVDDSGVSDDSAVSDSPPAPPAVSVTAASSGDEGTPATFVLTAAPAPQAPLAVTVDVAQTGDHAAAGQTGRRAVTVPVSGSATVRVATVDDNTDEADGSISLTVAAAAGYTLGTPAALTTPVHDNDDPPPPPADDRQQAQQQQQQQQQDTEPADEPDNPVPPMPQCDADTALLATVEAKITRHRDVTGRADLVTEFTAVRDAMAGDATALPTARGHAYARDGANALWTQIAAHLRHNCR